jgi:8-oxo-dGTP pyrophosphatase MutT (NUDIX family)
MTEAYVRGLNRQLRYGEPYAEPNCVLAIGLQFMHAVAMRGMRIAGNQAKALSADVEPRGRFIRLSRLRKLRACEQVAAVCYRARSAQIEFLLIRTRAGKRWTFPKGSAERGLTHAQAAALEAFEEAGVHGRIEETAFASYRRVGGDGIPVEDEAESINAYLCEVLRLGAAQESGRNRTWFSAGEAKERLREGRTLEQAGEFVRVIDKAVERIGRLMGSRTNVRWFGSREPFAGKSVRATRADKQQFADKSVRATQSNATRSDFNQNREDLSRPKDALQQVKFDFSEICRHIQDPSLKAERKRINPSRSRSLPQIGQCESLPCEILEFDPPKRSRLPN